MKKTIFLVTVLFFLVLAAGAQNNYKHSVGIMAGNFSGVSYKFSHKKFAFQCDAGWKYMFTSHQYMASYQDIFSQKNKEVQFFTFEINPNIMFQKNFKDQPSFIFIGLGGSYGYGKEISNYYGRDTGSKWGINFIFGVEYQFKIPLTIQLDFRPGYGKLSAATNQPGIIKDFHYYDWSFGLGVRYCFGQ